MNLFPITKYFYPHRILDIGANIGQFYEIAKTQFPDSYIFSIEASSECEPYLQKITDQYHICLLTKDDSVYNFYSRKDTGIGSGNSIYRELTSFYDDSNLNVIQKQGTMLDELFTEDSTFDLIKIDTQGSELDIISGGRKLCGSAKGILLEVSLTQYNENSPLISDVHEFMNNFGYEPKEILGVGQHPHTREVIQNDILYIKR
jgi:FkbM family methyltransferase